jgi:hypothetical protein
MYTMHTILKRLSTFKDYRGKIDDKLTVPVMIPAAPIPAIALPMMKATELGAAPQMAEAISNVKILARRTFFTGKQM